AKAALKAMLKFNKEHSKPNLFAEANDSIAVRFHLKKPRVHGLRKFKVIQLPHSDRDPGNSTVCLILSDQNAKTLRNPKNWPNEVDKNAQIWKDWLREEHGITGNEVDKVMTYVQFKREYRSKIDIARFLRSYDKIVIHEQLFKTMVKHFGKSCWNTNLFPVKVNVRSGKLKENILKAYSQETLLSPLNSITHVLRIGNIHQKPEFLLENLSAVLDAAAVILPGGLYNLRRAGIAWMTTNQELPVYVDFGAANEVIAKVPEEKIEVIEDECSTLPDGLKIRISSKGKIEVLDEQSGEPIFYPTIEDEWEKHDDLKPKHSKDSLIAREVKKRKVQEIKKLAKKARLAKGNANKKE
uniref:NMDA receptor-regulated protein 2 n=2 Tax=Bursaphelenchus xylophilus TaxID=6326 RepID=A0A1I7SHA2_BURXY